MKTIYDALAELEGKATGGRWEYHEEDNILDSPGVAHRLIDIIPRSIDVGNAERIANGRFIAAARNAVPTLIADVKALAEALKLLLHEVDESAIASATDYGWPVAVEKSRAALARIQGEAG